jgi:hypothetical protein
MLTTVTDVTGGNGSYFIVDEQLLGKIVLAPVEAGFDSGLGAFKSRAEGRHGGVRGISGKTISGRE